MDYLKLTDEEFINETLKLYENINLEVLEYLRKTPKYIEILKYIIDKRIATGPKLHRLNTFMSYYNSYIIVYNLKAQLEHPEKYSEKEKEDIINKICGSIENVKSIKFLQKQDHERIEFILKHRHFIKEKKYQKEQIIKNEDYNETIIKLKKIIYLYRQYENDNKKFVFYLYSILNIKDYNKICRNIIYLYFQKTYMNINHDFLNDLSLDEIITLLIINNVYNNRDYFDCRSYFTSVAISYKKIELQQINPKEYEKLFKLIDKIKELVNKNYEYEYIIEYIINQKITIEELENNYKPILKKCFYLQYEKKHNFDRTLDFRDIYILEDAIIESYKDMVSRVKNVLEIILSEREDIDKIIKIIYQAKYINNKTPVETKYLFHQKLTLAQTKEEKIKIINFLKGYYKYYEENQQEKQEVIQNEKKQKQIDNIEQYASIIKAFLDSKYDQLNEYFDNTNIDKKEFYNALEILKENNHPIYEQYKEQIEKLQSQRFAIILSKTKKIIEIMKNGTQLENGETKKFDILDYYSYTKLSIEKFLKIIKNNVSNTDYALAARALAKYKNDKLINKTALNQVLNTNYSYVTETDELGNILSTYTATIEDKEQVLIILNEKDIPLTTSTYSIMLRNYIMENYSKNKEKIKTKKN